jgi:hypothetical protein
MHKRHIPEQMMCQSLVAAHGNTNMTKANERTNDELNRYSKQTNAKSLSVVARIRVLGQKERELPCSGPCTQCPKSATAMHVAMNVAMKYLCMTATRNLKQV